MTSSDSGGRNGRGGDESRGMSSSSSQLSIKKPELI